MELCKMTKILLNLVRVTLGFFKLTLSKITLSKTTFWGFLMYFIVSLLCSWNEVAAPQGKACLKLWKFLEYAG